MLGTIYNIQRFSVHDGPGVRTTVFLKGCPLRCCWCHNPESQRSGPELSYNSRCCVGCGSCAGLCPEGAHTVDAKTGHRFDAAKCAACGACAESCFSGALELIGYETDVGALMERLRRDAPYYSGGGVTISGGEPLMQAEFTLELLAALKDEGIHSAVDTCGYASGDVVARASERAGMFLYDLKLMSPERHKEYTGVSNERILENYKLLIDRGARVAVRVPVIGGVNDTAENWDAMEALLLEHPPESVKFLPYHKLGSAKYERIGRKPVTFWTPVDDRLQELNDRFSKKGILLERD